LNSTTSLTTAPNYTLAKSVVHYHPGAWQLIGTGIFSWSVFKKVKTGSGLNTDPAGLLGAAEGLSFLVVLGGIAIAALNLNDYGFLPGFLPNDKCFGIND
jgi:hypothetical protein